MNFLPNLAARVIGKPLIVKQNKLEIVLSVLGERIGIEAKGPVPSDSWDPEKSLTTYTADGIATVPIHGTLVKRVGAVEAMSGLISYSQIETMVMDAATDPNVRGIMLSVDSHGGEVGDGFDVVKTIRQASQLKPVWAVVNDAFSGGYLLASAATRIFIPQAAGVGSIGVIAVHVDESKADAQAGRKYTTIFAGDRKNDFSSHEPLTSEAKSRLQGEVDRLYSMFSMTVATNRGMTDEAVRATQAGIYFGQDALSSGLADQVGTMREALDQMSQSFVEKNTITQSMEKKKMPLPQDATPVVANSGLDHEAIRTEMLESFRSQANEIMQLCQIAGSPEMAGAFIAKGVSVEDVRKSLLACRAGGGQEICSDIKRGTSDPSAKSGLFDACAQLANGEIR
ncbi:MAG: S49 family peptidase [Magnetococcales bacterium]|nr:S49 family peptidase [Magnetococcales bacterium]